MSLMKLKVTQAPKMFAIVGRYFKVISASDSVKVRFTYQDDSDLETELYQGLGIEHSKPFKSFFIDSSIDQEVIIFASDAKLTDDRLEMAVTGAATLENGNDTLTANTVKQILPTRLGRRSTLIVTEQDTYIGGENLNVNNGILVESGQSLEINTQSAIFALSVTGGKVRHMSEVN